MSNEHFSMRSPLSKAKGLGAAHDGTHHWWLQRVTALIMLPLVVWFVISIVKLSVNPQSATNYMRSPINMVLLMVFVTTGLYHGLLGMKVILEDYIHCNIKRMVINVMLQFIVIISLFMAVTAIITSHLSV